MPEMNEKLRGELDEILEKAEESASPVQSQNVPASKLELRHAALAFGTLQFIRFLKGPKNQKGVE
ncbi:MAG: hypothetical protein ACRKGH_03785 [Dehalogenimonas sp.]